MEGRGEAAASLRVTSTKPVREEDRVERWLLAHPVSITASQLFNALNIACLLMGTPNKPYSSTINYSTLRINAGSETTRVFFVGMYSAWCVVRSA